MEVPDGRDGFPQGIAFAALQPPTPGDDHPPGHHRRLPDRLQIALPPRRPPDARLRIHGSGVVSARHRVPGRVEGQVHLPLFRAHPLAQLGMGRHQGGEPPGLHQRPAQPRPDGFRHPGQNAPHHGLHRQPVPVQHPQMEPRPHGVHADQLERHPRRDETRGRRPGLRRRHAALPRRGEKERRGAPENRQPHEKALRRQGPDHRFGQRPARDQGDPRRRRRGGGRPGRNRRAGPGGQTLGRIQPEPLHRGVHAADRHRKRDLRT